MFLHVLISVYTVHYRYIVGDYFITL